MKRTRGGNNVSTARQFQSVQPQTRHLSEGLRDSLSLCFRLPNIELSRDLTVAERRIVWGLLSGCSNQQIALNNGLSSRTIAVQMQQMLNKLGVSSRHGLLAVLLQADGEHLNAEHLATRARVFSTDTSVFAVERLVPDARDTRCGALPANDAAHADSRQVWQQILRGELALTSVQSLGDLRFLSLTQRDRVDEKQAREGCLRPWDMTLLKGVGSGVSNQQLAEQLGVSQPTVSVWTRRALGKLGLSHRAELIRLLAQAPTARIPDAPVNSERRIIAH